MHTELSVAIEFDRIKRRLAKTLKVSWTLVDGDIELISFAGNSGSLLYSPLFDLCNFQEARFALDPLIGFGGLINALVGLKLPGLLLLAVQMPVLQTN
uniref:Uncharacterized protein n=1 Tax=Glossina palpalis gambiensis TaxID=67801 RepID=A0A1B0C072_9MUSC